MSFVNNFQVLIIGGGVIGLSLARELQRRGVEKIGILEKNQICGAEASSAAAGMLAPQSEADRIDDFFRFCAESRDSYPEFAAGLFDETGTDIELDRNGTLYLAFNDEEAAELERRYAWQKNANLQIEKLTAQEVLEIEPNVSPNVVFGLLFPNDWQVENRRLIAALKDSIERSSIEVYTDTEVRRLLIENGAVIGAETANRKFYAEKIVLSAGAWSSLIDAESYHFPLKMEPIRGQMLSFQGAERLFSKVIYTARGYLVPRRSGRILAGATVEHVGFDKSLTAAGEEFLRHNAFEIAPGLAKLQLSEKWAGLRPQAADSLPILGAFPGVKNLFAATAHYRNGILLAPKTAEIMADAITGSGESAYLKAFGPQRFTAAAGKTVTNRR